MVLLVLGAGVALFLFLGGEEPQQPEPVDDPNVVATAAPAAPSPEVARIEEPTAPATAEPSRLGLPPFDELPPEAQPPAMGRLAEELRGLLAAEELGVGVSLDCARVPCLVGLGFAPDAEQDPEARYARAHVLAADAAGREPSAALRADDPNGTRSVLVWVPEDRPELKGRFIHEAQARTGAYE